MFQPIELRKQATDNRQSSTEVLSEKDTPFRDSFEVHPFRMVNSLLIQIESLYNELLKQGVARECARMVLPMATTTKIYMTGNIRSWLHFIAIRDDEHAQKEIQLIAKKIKKLLLPIIPHTLKALE
jgi:thymidylate synthase (FAD)